MDNWIRVRQQREKRRKEAVRKGSEGIKVFDDGKGARTLHKARKPTPSSKRERRERQEGSATKAQRRKQPGARR